MNPRTSSLVATLLLMASVVALLLVTHSLIAKLPIGVAIQIAAAVLMLWARLTFGMRSFHAAANPTQGGLVTNGPYRFWRHPIYAAVLIFMWTGVFTQGTMPSLLSVLFAVVATVATAVRIKSEETLLNDTFPDYAAYAARTKRIIPFLY